MLERDHEGMETMIPDGALRKALEAITGDEPAVLASDVHWDLRNPCADCPFIKSSPYHQGVAESIPALCESIDNGSFAHTCHKTDYRKQCDGPVAGKETGRAIQECAGSTLMLLKTGNGKDLQLPLLQAMESGKFSSEAVQEMTARAKRDPNIFTIREFLHFYARKLNQMVAKRRKRK